MNMNYLSEGLKLVALSAIVYIETFMYRYSYAEYFNIPRDFITISIDDLVSVGSFVALILVIVFNAFFTIWVLSKEGSRVKRLFRLFPIQLSVTVLLIAGIFAGAAISGKLTAKGMTSFPFVNDEAILAKYGNQFLLCKYDDKTGTFSKTFRLVDASDMNQPFEIKSLDQLKQEQAGVKPPESTPESNHTPFKESSEASPLTPSK